MACDRYLMRQSLDDRLTVWSILSVKRTPGRFHEDVREDLELRSRLNKIMFNGSSDFQHIQVWCVGECGHTSIQHTAVLLSGQQTFLGACAILSAFFLWRLGSKECPHVCGGDTCRKCLVHSRNTETLPVATPNDVYEE